MAKTQSTAEHPHGPASSTGRTASSNPTSSTPSQLPTIACGYLTPHLPALPDARRELLRKVHAENPVPLDYVPTTRDLFAFPRNITFTSNRSAPSALAGQIKDHRYTMSIIQQHTSATLSDAWRTINIDALQEDSACNFDTSTLHPPQPEIGEDEVRQLAGQVRQLLRGGDAEGALRGCLEFPVYNGPDAAKDAHLQTITEVLQSIKASEMTPLLKSIYGSAGGPELLDVLMKYIYKGMAGSAAAAGGLKSPPPQAAPGGFSQMGGRPGGSNESVGSAMSVLLSWHEKVVDVAGLGTIGRVMTDWRRV